MNVVYVDLSANAEQLSQDSAIAVSDGVKWVCLARSKVKRYLAESLAERYGRRNLQFGANFLRIENVKGSEADRLARAVFQGRSPPDRIATIQEVRRLLEKIEKGRGSPLGT